MNVTQSILNILILSTYYYYFNLQHIHSCEDVNVDLHMYYNVNMAVVNYFGAQIQENIRN